MAHPAAPLLVCSNASCDFTTPNPTNLSNHHQEASIGGMWGCPHPTCGKVFCKKGAVIAHVLTCDDFKIYNTTIKKYGREFNDKWVPVSRTRALQVAGTLGKKLVWNAGEKTSGTLKADGSGKPRQFRGTPTAHGRKRKAEEVYKNEGVDVVKDEGEDESDGEEDNHEAYNPEITSRLTSRQLALTKLNTLTPINDRHTKSETIPSESEDASSFGSRSAFGPAANIQEVSTTVATLSDNQDGVNNEPGGVGISDSQKMNEAKDNIIVSQPMRKVPPPPPSRKKSIPTRESARISSVSTSSKLEAEGEDNKPVAMANESILSGEMAKGKNTREQQSIQDEGREDGQKELQATQELQIGPDGASITQKPRHPAGKSIDQEKRDRTNWEIIMRTKQFTPDDHPDKNRRTDGEQNFKKTPNIAQSSAFRIARKVRRISKAQAATGDFSTIRYACSVCGMSFTFLPAAQNHVSSSRVLPHHTCSACDFSICREEQLEDHLDGCGKLKTLMKVDRGQLVNLIEYNSTCKAWGRWNSYKEYMDSDPKATGAEWAEIEAEEKAAVKAEKVRAEMITLKPGYCYE